MSLEQEITHWFKDGFFWVLGVLAMTWFGIAQYFNSDTRSRVKSLEADMYGKGKDDGGLAGNQREMRKDIRKLVEWSDNYMREEMSAHDDIADALGALTTHVRTLRVKNGEEIDDVLRDENGAAGRIERRKQRRDEIQTLKKK